jgi:tetratricopeptide (TPR) repeat protein
MTRQLNTCSLAAVCLLVSGVLLAQPPAPAAAGQAGARGGGQAAAQGPGADLLKQGQQQLREGNLQDALASFRAAGQKATAGSTVATTAAVQAGGVLDLMGQYAEARTEFTRAIDGATAPADKARAARAMAVSYGFQRNCDGAAKYEAPLYQSYLDAKDFFNAGEVANELARLCLESGATDQAATWYQRGYQAGLQEPGLKPERKDLWEFRWEHAQARLAARRGQPAEAQKHVAAATAIFDKGTNPEQAPFVPYLIGYVAFYGGDYKTALSELQKGNQSDPFILALIGQAYEKSGEKDKAMEYYRKVMASTAHNPSNAYARPLAKEKLAGK